MIENSNTQFKNSNSKIDKSNLKILEEQLSYESMLNKKLNQYAMNCEDTQLKRLCHQAAQKHKSNYESMLNYLNSHQ